MVIKINIVLNFSNLISWSQWFFWRRIFVIEYAHKEKNINTKIFRYAQRLGDISPNTIGKMLIKNKTVEGVL